jgi:hypothetical protein
MTSKSTENPHTNHKKISRKTVETLKQSASVETVQRLVNSAAVEQQTTQTVKMNTCD